MSKENRYPFSRRATGRSKQEETVVTPSKAEERKIPEVYVVVQEIGQKLFQKMVNEWIDKGYACIGGCDCKSISANPKAWIFTQALIKK